MNYKTKSFMTKKRAFTLIELLIVIAIIGILFIVLVSKVDFATDKAKATGVQTDFRSFQVAFDTVAKENAGFNTFGWDTGDANQDGIHNSYDEGDNGAGGGIAKNGIQDGAEVFTGHKVYAETFTKVFSLKKNGTGSYDRDALNRLETAINANLDPKLHITIKDDGEIVMANGAQDPWDKEYHGQYYSAEDGKDRGAIFMFSDGPNNAYGSEWAISNGVASVTVPNNNKNGKDDYSLVSVYSYLNGYGEVLNVTTGFSNNQSLIGGNGLTNVGQAPVVPTPGDGTGSLPTPNLDGAVAGTSSPIAYSWSELKTLAQANLGADELRDTYGIEVGDYKEINSIKYILVDLDGNNYEGFVFMYNSGTQKAMNDPATNQGGYVSTNVMKPYVDGLYDGLSTDLQSAMKKVTITCNSGDLNKDGIDDNGMSTYTTDAYLFLPSAKEVGITISRYQYDAEGQAFDYFSVGTTTVRAIFASSDMANIENYWWVRSAESSKTSSFYSVRTNGSSGPYYVANAYDVVPAFVIG